MRPHDVNPLHSSPWRSKEEVDSDAGRWIYWGENYPPEILRDFRKRLNATLNDVALTAISRGLHRYMELVAGQPTVNRKFSWRKMLKTFFVSPRITYSL
jgi:hypothetical protein